MSTTARVSSAAVTGAWLPAVPLLLYALAFAWKALGGGLLVFDDHPGQLYRIAHALTVGLAPWRLNPGWWAGYAELQFYPPGFSYAGAALHYASLGALDLSSTYQLLLWITFLLPGVSAYLLLARVLGSPWLALPGAFLALTLSAGSRSGVEEGMRWGLVAARLGWGVLPLLALSLHGWVEGKRPPVAARPGGPADSRRAGARGVLAASAVRPSGHGAPARVERGFARDPRALARRAAAAHHPDRRQRPRFRQAETLEPLITCGPLALRSAAGPGARHRARRRGCPAPRTPLAACRSPAGQLPACLDPGRLPRPRLRPPMPAQAAGMEPRHRLHRPLQPAFLLESTGAQPLPVAAKLA